MREVIGSMSEWSGLLKDFFRQIDDGSFTRDMMEAVVDHRNPFVIPTKHDLIAKSDSMPALFTEEMLAKWAKYNLKPVFFPGLEIHEKFQAEGYVNPEPWFYQVVRDGKVKPVAGLTPTTLRRGWYLADFTIGVDYANGTQVFPNDPMASLIAKLRKENKLGKYDKTPLGSRFAITNDEWQTVLLPAYAVELGFTPAQVRLERTIEFNFIGNLYDANRGKFNMWEWFADPFGDSLRLYGGCRGHGGLAHVHYYGSVRRDDGIAGRPLVSFVPQS